MVEFKPIYQEKIADQLDGDSLVVYARAIAEDAQEREYEEFSTLRK